MLYSFLILNLCWQKVTDITLLELPAKLITNYMCSRTSVPSVCSGHKFLPSKMENKVNRLLEITNTPRNKRRAVEETECGVVVADEDLVELKLEPSLSDDYTDCSDIFQDLVLDSNDFTYKG